MARGLQWIHLLHQRIDYSVLSVGYVEIIVTLTRKIIGFFRSSCCFKVSIAKYWLFHNLKSLLSPLLPINPWAQNMFLLCILGGVLHGSRPDVHDDSSVFGVWVAGGCVRVPGTVWRMLPHHDGSHSVWAGGAHAGLAGHRLPSGPHGSSYDSRSTHRW